MSQTNEETVMFAVLVKTEARSDVCEDGKFWVKDETHEYYVSERERGLWKSKDDAGKAITESYEEIVEVKMKTTEDRLNVVQARLDERGLSDIKISFTPNVSGMSKEKLGCLVSALLDDHLSGKSGALALFGDSELN